MMLREEEPSPKIKVDKNGIRGIVYPVNKGVGIWDRKAIESDSLSGFFITAVIY